MILSVAGETEDIATIGTDMESLLFLTDPVRPVSVGKGDNVPRRRVVLGEGEGYDPVFGVL